MAAPQKVRIAWASGAGHDDIIVNRVEGDVMHGTAEERFLSLDGSEVRVFFVADLANPAICGWFTQFGTRISWRRGS